MHDYWSIRRLGPGPRTFSRRQHQQQKPIGGCLTFKQRNGTDGFAQLKLQCEPQFYATGKPKHYQPEPQQFGHSSGEPSQLDQQQFYHSTGEPQFFWQP